MDPEIYTELARIELDWIKKIDEILSEDPKNEFMTSLRIEKEQNYKIYIECAKQLELELKTL